MSCTTFVWAWFGLHVKLNWVKFKITRQFLCKPQHLLSLKSFELFSWWSTFCVLLGQPWVTTVLLHCLSCSVTIYFQPKTSVVEQKHYYAHTHTHHSQITHSTSMYFCNILGEPKKKIKKIKNLCHNCTVLVEERMINLSTIATLA
jgi:hypothetical protein